MRRRGIRIVRRAWLYLFMSVTSLIMIYPLLWMFFGAFKSNSELFGSMSLLPKAWGLEGFVNGWKGSGFVTYTTYFINTFRLLVPSVVLGTVSSILVAYGFARFAFFGKKLCFTVMICTMLLPGTTMIIPRYILFNKLGWLNTYLPLIVPMAFGTVAFNNFMLLVFFKGIPKALTEAAVMDGAGSFRILWQMYVPLAKPSIITIVIFICINTWNNFMEPMIYINSTEKFPIALALRSTFNQSEVSWNKALAMSFCAVIPVILVFLAAQRYFVEGVATTGMKE